MAKKKASLLGVAWSCFKFAFSAIRRLAAALWAFAKNALGKAEIEGRRPKNKPAYAPLAELEPSDGRLPEFESKLYSSESAVGLILGSRGSGKSALGMRLLENVAAKTGKKVSCMGFDKKLLPRWIEPIERLEGVRNNSFLLVDEGGVEFSSRSSMSSANKLLSELLLISRHKGISVLFISQNSSNIEVNAIRQSDYLLLKQPSLLQLDFERKAIRDIYERVKGKFGEYKSEKGVVYVYSDQYSGFAANMLPSFWSEGISKSYRDRK